MKTELGYDVSGPDAHGELEVSETIAPDYGCEGRYDVVYLTRNDLVAMLARYDDAEDAK